MNSTSMRFRTYPADWLFLLGAAVACLSAQTSGTASISGVLASDKGKPISDAVVIAVRHGLPPAGGRALAARDGSFQIKNLPAGTYSLCTQVPGGDFLDPCIWSLLPPSATVGAAQSLAGIQLKLAPAATLQVRLNDPQGLLNPAPGKKIVPEVLLGVTTPRGVLHPVSLAAKDNNGRTHQVAIPFDTAVKFKISSPHLALSDQAGAAVPSAGSSLQFTQASAVGQIKVLTFNVSGPRP